MKEAYSFSHFLDALAAWDAHLARYIASLEKANAPIPSPDQLTSYRSVWVEGFLEARTEPKPS
jgi:hypothetical protein